MISVVIPAFNEEVHIKRCLESLTLQKTKEKFEVIVVDNNSTDKTAEVASTFKNKLNLRIVSEPKKGRGAARNTGFKEVKGDLILSTDADAIVPPHWIDVLTHNLRSDNRIVVVSGTHDFSESTFFLNYVVNWGTYIGIQFYRLVQGHYWLSGYNFGIKKEAYEKSGGFSRSLNAFEDTDLGHRVAKHGKIKFLFNVPVLVSGRRYKYGFKGMIPYLKHYYTYFTSTRTRKDYYLEDVR